VRARTYVADLQGPLPEPQREGLAYCLRMLWGGLEPQVSPDDWRAFARLSQPGSADCLPERPDYYGFVTYTLVSGDLEGRPT
jgi:hypothetical protein